MQFNTNIFEQQFRFHEVHLPFDSRPPGEEIQTISGRCDPGRWHFGHRPLYQLRFHAQLPGGRGRGVAFTRNVEHETEYSFDAYIQMEITTYKKNGNLDDQVVYDNYLHKEDADYAMVFKDGNDKSTIIFDTKNSAMLILSESDGEKTGFATTIDPEAMADLVEDYEEEEEVDMDSYRPMKTGKTKQILGYSCDEYLVKDEDIEVHMWVSEKLGKEMRKEWMSNKQTFGAMFTHAYALNGMVLEYDVMDKDGGKSVMQVKKIDMNHSHKVNTSGYTIMSMRQKTEDE